VNVQTNWDDPPPPPPDFNPQDCLEEESEYDLLEQALELAKGLLEEFALDVIQYKCDTAYPDNTSTCAELTEAIDNTTGLIETIDGILAALNAECPQFANQSPPYSPLPYQQNKSQTFNVVSSWDPNAKSGPAGTGAAHVVTGFSLPYTIFFQNDASATAPAQQIFIVDPLDPALNENKVSLGMLVLGSLSIDVGPGQHASKTIDLRPNTNALLLVQADLRIPLKARDMSHLRHRRSRARHRIRPFPIRRRLRLTLTRRLLQIFGRIPLVVLPSAPSMTSLQSPRTSLALRCWPTSPWAAASAGLNRSTTR
jgi:hypothetical protein